MAYNYEKERGEAIRAGERARISLKNALDILDSARGWGIYDILGGGFISTIVKHSKMDKASDYIKKSREDLKEFSRELGDIRGYADINLETGDFWGFADLFFDGLLSDLMMQERINEARSQIQRAIDKVDYVLNRLNGRR